jgi:hypothetical protein
MNDHVHLSISIPVVYNRTTDLFNELSSFKLITTANSDDLLEALSCRCKSNHMKTFDRILFRRSTATNHSGIKQSPGP